MTEQEYRQLPSHEYFSQSLLVGFDREGASSLINKKIDLDYKKQIRFGKICHHLALLPDTFDDTYKVSEYFPTESYLKITDMLVKLYEDGAFTKKDIIMCNEDYTKAAFDIIMRSDVWNNIKKEDTVSSKVCDKGFANYLVDVIEAKKENKVLVNSQEFIEAKQIADYLRSDERLKEYFISGDVKERQILFEIPILLTIKDQKFKAMLDSIQIDHKEKTIGFSDLKVTETPYSMFESFFIKMRRDIQSFVYSKALEEFMDKEGLKDYKVLDPIYIYAQRGNPEMSMPFKIDRNIVNRAYSGFYLGNRKYKGVSTLIDEIQWHFKNKEFKLPKEFVEKGFMRFSFLEENATTSFSSDSPRWKYYGVQRSSDIIDELRDGLEEQMRVHSNATSRRSSRTNIQRVSVEGQRYGYSTATETQSNPFSETPSERRNRLIRNTMNQGISRETAERAVDNYLNSGSTGGIDMQ